MNGAVRALEVAARAGVDVCFANPGTTEMPLVGALDAVPSVRAVLGLFEGVCTGAADGYGRMTGRPALTLLHLGPGFANGIANLHNARRAHTPVVNLIGDHASWHLEHDAPLTSDIDSLAAPVSAWLRTSKSADALPQDMADAIASARSGNGSVSTLVLPADHQAGATTAVASPLEPRRAPAVDGSAIDAAAARLVDASAARPPALLLGGAALSEAGLLAAGRIAARTGCRLVSETFSARQERGRDITAPERLPYLPEQANELLRDESLLILAGARDPVSFFGYEGIPSVIAGDVPRHVLASPDEAVVDALEALADAVGAGAGTLASAPPPPSRDQLPGGELNVGTLGTILAALIPEQAIVVDEAATSGLAFSALSAGAARHTVLALTGGAIGQGLPCATGAAIACPDRRVIAFQADGSAMYTLQALWTQARESLDVTTVLCSNRAYRILQMELGRAGIFEPGPQARALTNLDQPSLDWVALAKGCGVPGERVDTCEGFRDALEASFGEPGPRLIEALI